MQLEYRTTFFEYSDHVHAKQVAAARYMQYQFDHPDGESLFKPERRGSRGRRVLRVPSWAGRVVRVIRITLRASVVLPAATIVY